MALIDQLKQLFSTRKQNFSKKQNSQSETSKKNNNPSGSDRPSFTESDKRASVSRLTPREHDLYLLLLEGFTLKESAGQLAIKYPTANTHMNNIYKKLGVRSRAQLIINYRNVTGAAPES